MPVKDLVALYDSGSPPQSRRLSTGPGRAQDAQSPGGESSTRSKASYSRDQSEIPSPARARFLKHPLLKEPEAPPLTLRDVGLPDAPPTRATPQSAASSSRTTLNDPFDDTHTISPPPAPSAVHPVTLSRFHPAPSSSPPVTEPPEYTPLAETKVASTSSPRIPGSHFTRWLSSTPTGAAPPEEDSSEYEMLLSKRTSYVPDSPSTFSPPYVPSIASTPTVFQHKSQSPSRASTSTAIGPGRIPHSGANHAPVPVTKILKRNAPPLYIPALDRYLESLPAPDFSRWTGKGKDTTHRGKHKKEEKKGDGMFPPMDRLAATGKSIDDLETNSYIPFTSKQRLLKSFVNGAISLAGSSALSSYYSLQGVFNTMQIFALILRTIVPYEAHGLGEKWRKLFLGTIPNMLALNFASTIIQSLLYLLIFLSISSALLFYFWRVTERCAELQNLEGLQVAETKNYGVATVCVTFILAVIYLPVSTMAVHVLTWSDDLWVVPNPYKNATTWPPQVDPLGSPEEWRDPLSFCYTTTMRKNEINWAPVLVLVALVVSSMLTVWFPWRLHSTLKLSVPVVDKYNEMGTVRSSNDMDREYERLLDRDEGPFSFLYREFRRGWGTYEPYYLLAKCVALLVVAVISPDNCLFRSFNRSKISIIRQSLLTGATLIFFGTHSWLNPFLSPTNNASEWFSRGNYVFTSILAFLVALNVRGSDHLSGWVLYVNYAVTYSLSFYFIIIDTGVVQRFVKGMTGRLDFSIDIFSPRMDISPNSHHTRRRIWQESISTLFLTSANCRIPEDQKMRFAHAPDSEYAPYLLDFRGTPAERHVENLKILRDVGSSHYARAVALTTGSDADWFLPVSSEIQRHFVGPDCYWRDPANDDIPGCTQYFGNAWWIPFPPTLVMKYDDGPLVTIKDPHHLHVYLAQNRSLDIRRRRDIRMALRAMDGRVVAWPYTHIEPVGGVNSWFGKKYQASTAVHYQHATLRIQQRGRLSWDKIQLGSGFEVELHYAKKIVVPASVFGLDDDYDLTPSLARFLQLNERLVPDRLAHVENVFSRYKIHHLRECEAKARTLSYKFLTIVYNRPADIMDLPSRAAKDEHDDRARNMLLGKDCTHALAAAHQRLVQVSTSEVATWWYIFWDDLWRRNFDSHKQLRVHAVDINPHYPTSIAYTPLPRAALEAFLAQRGLLRRPSKWGDVFHSGVLNKLYLRLNDVAFHGSRRARILHLGHEPSRGNEGDFADLDAETLGAPSSLGTGGGTDHDDDAIRARPAYRWEGILDDPYRPHGGWRRRPWTSKIKAWMGIDPHWSEGPASSGVAVDARLERGRYILSTPPRERGRSKDGKESMFDSR